jgi:hypothetical protein
MVVGYGDRVAGWHISPNSLHHQMRGRYRNPAQTCETLQARRMGRFGSPSRRPRQRCGIPVVLEVLRRCAWKDLRICRRIGAAVRIRGSLVAHGEDCDKIVGKTGRNSFRMCDVLAEMEVRDSPRDRSFAVLSTVYCHCKSLSRFSSALSDPPQTRCLTLMAEYENSSQKLPLLLRA